MIIGAAISLVCCFAGCRENVSDFELVPLEPTVVLTMNLMNGQELVQRNEAFTDESGIRVSPLEFKTMLSRIELRKANGEWTEIADALFFDFKPIDTTINNPQWGSSSSIYVPEGSYDRIRFGLGLPEDLNSIDPSTRENEDPLSIYTNMYWTWATMYRFVILEAKIDTLGGDNTNKNVLFHTGLDTLYSGGLEFPVNLELSNFDREELVLGVDWNGLFHHGLEEIDLTKTTVSHTTDSEEQLDLARRFTDNFSAAIQLK